MFCETFFSAVAKKASLINARLFVSFSLGPLRRYLTPETGSFLYSFVEEDQTMKISAEDLTM